MRIESPRTESAASSQAPSPRPAALAPLAAHQPDAVLEEITASITGTVVDPEGRPVPGARVIAIADDAPTAPPIDGGPRSDEAGRFEIGGLDPAPRYHVVADAAGFAPGAVRSVASGSDVLVTLERGGTLRGFVRDLAERPIAGARVTFRAIVHGARWERSAVSGADGAYRVAALPECRRFMDCSLLLPNLVASAPGYSTVRIDPLAIERGVNLLEKDVYLSRPAIVTGRVLDAETESPIAGARVRLLSFEDELRYSALFDFERINPFAGEPLAESVADGDGRFALEGVAAWGVHTPGMARFGLASLDARMGEAVATATGYAAGSARVMTPASGATVEVEIRAWPAAVVTGLVVDGSGLPMEGIHVTASNPECGTLPPSLGDDGASALTDAAGRYRLAAVSARRLAHSTVSIRASGVETSVSVRAGETVEAPDIVLPSRARLLVRVTDLDGKPVRGAAVAEGVFQSPRGRTDTAGLFELREFEREEGPMLPVRAWVRAEGFGSEVSEAVTPSTNDPPPSVSVRLGPEHRISGRVAYESGKPVGGARILVALANASPADLFFEDFEDVPDAAAAWLRADAFSESDGTFEVGSLPPGPYHVQVRLHERRERRKEERVVAENVPTGASDLLLVLADPGVEELRVPLEGTVRDRETGELLVHMRVLLLGARSHEDLSAAAVAPGRFRFDAVGPGVYDLEVGARGYAKARLRDIAVTAAGADRPLDVRLDRGVTVRGTVRATTGEPFLDGNLYFNPAGDGAPEFVVLDRDGAYETTVLDRGARYTIAVRDETPTGEGRAWFPIGGNSLVVPVDADVFTRDIEVTPAGSCAVSTYGTALYPGGAGDEASMAESLVRLREDARLEFVASDGRVVWGRTGIASAFYLIAIPHGQYAVRLHVRGQPPAERTVTVTQDDMARVSFGEE